MPWCTVHQQLVHSQRNRVVSFLAGLILVPGILGGPEERKLDEQILQMLVDHSGMIVSARLEEGPENFESNIGYRSYRCKFRCLEVLLGKKPQSSLFTVWFERVRNGPFPKYSKGETFILFLRLPGSETRLVANYAGIQPYSDEIWKIAMELKNKTALSEEARAKIRYAGRLALSVRMYVSENRGSYPTNFIQTAKFFSSDTEGEKEFSPSQFEIVCRGSKDSLSKYASPDKILLIRERQPWQNADGKWAKTYVFLDYSINVRAEPDGDFETWEKQHLVPPELTKK